MSKIRETCKCGALLEYEGKYPRGAAIEFRNAHRICRENRWRLPPTVAGIKSGGSNTEGSATGKEPQ